MAVAMTLTVLASAARAQALGQLKLDSVLIDFGTADFGGGVIGNLHAGGRPTDSGYVSWSFTSVSGKMTARADVTSKAGKDKKSQQQFAAELAKDRTSILKLSGADSLRNRMLRRIESDASLLRKIGEQLKQGSADMKANVKRHHPRLATPGERLASIAFDDTSDTVVILVIYAACILCPPLGVAVAELALDAVAVTIGQALTEAALNLTLALKANASNDKREQDAIGKCQDDAYAACDKCNAAAEKLISPLDFAAEEACEGVLLLQLAACLLL